MASPWWCFGLITDSIERSAKRRYLSYSEADLEVFRPIEATRCTDWGEIWHGGGDRCKDLQNWNFYWDLIKIWNINTPQGRIPCAIFTKLADLVPLFNAVKISLDLFKGLWCYGVFKLTGSGYPQIFSAPSGETVRQTPKVLEVQERARGTLLPCQVWWSSDFTRRRGGQKRWVFCLSACLFVLHAFERQRLCARFRHEGVGIQKRFWFLWIGEGL